MTREKKIKRIELLNEKNKNSYYEYEKLFANKSDMSKIGYLNTALNFLSGLNCDIGDASIEVFKRFITEAESDRNTIKRIDYLKDFLNIIDQHKDFSVKPEDLEQFRIKSKNIQPKNESHPLFYSEIIGIRDYLFTNGHYSLLFTFELFYSIGLTLKETKEINAESIDFTNKKIKFKEKSYITDNILKLVSDHNVVLKEKNERHYQDQIEKIGNLIERKQGLKFRDISATRKKYFLCCQNCNEIFPPEAEYWMLINYSCDPMSTKWLICKNCAPKLYAITS